MESMVLGRAEDVYMGSHWLEACGCSGKGLRLEERPMGGGGR